VQADPKHDSKRWNHAECKRNGYNSDKFDAPQGAAFFSSHSIDAEQLISYQNNPESSS
jgi:hypothetical protein